MQAEKHIIEPTNKSLRTLFIVFIVLLTAGAIGASTWYVKSNEIASKEKEISVLKKQLEESKTNELVLDTESKDQSGKIFEVVSYEKLERVASLRFQFTRDVDQTTLKKGNINLYSKGASLGTAGQRDLNNDLIAGIAYEEKEKILTVNLVDEQSLGCASCVWQMEFTNKIKDSKGNALKEDTFDF